MHRPLALGIALLGLAACLLGKTYVILPFHNTSGAPNLDWIGESVSETVRETLVSYGVPAVRRQELKDAARKLSIRLPALLTEATVIRLARKLGADRVIYGKFIYSPGARPGSSQDGSLRILARSIDIQRFTRGPHWDESGPVAELSQLQSRLAWRVLTYASPAAPSEKQFFAARAPVKFPAMESYIRGLLAPTLEQQHLLFAQAANLDPKFSPPCFELGRIEWAEHSYRPAARWLERVRPDDAHYLKANFLLGLCRYYTGDYAGALSAFELVAKLVPLGEVYNNLAIAQYRYRRPGAIENLRKAIRGNPKDPDYHFNLGYLLWRRGDLAGALVHFRRALALDPDDAEARRMLKRCENNDGPRRGDLSTKGLERLKENYERIAGQPPEAEKEETGG